MAAVSALRQDLGEPREDCFDGDHSFEDIGLAAGQSQEEKKRSYKDFLREEEEITAQVRNSSKKRLKDNILSLELSLKKKSSPQSADTTMDLLKGITSPLAKGTKPPQKTGEKSSSSSSHSESKKEHHRKKVSRSSGELSLEDGGSHKSKKMKPLYVNTETLTLREPDGLKMKLILSPKEKGSSSLRSFLKTAWKNHKSFSDSRSSPGPEGYGSDASQFPESHSANLDLSGLEPILVESGSSSGGELEAGELVIYDSYWEIKKKKNIPYTGAAAPPPPFPGLYTDRHSEKKKREGQREREEKPKKNMSAYQVFFKGYPTARKGQTDLEAKTSASSTQTEQSRSYNCEKKSIQLRRFHQSESFLCRSTVAPKKCPPTNMLLLPASPDKAPETEPVDVAAHLQLVGESLSLTGHHLQETEGMVAVSGNLSVLLDSIICVLGPLACVTTQLPELNGCPKQVLSNTLDHIAYIMPGQ
ncbi:hypothetical protein EI555_005521 [Monodon monoceros]|uniref:DUF4171 domain-containing protein n=1 Tax=Monodon monoceros TaxID=40151 RepID=A0A4U1FDP3_MONMO|nr:hypothetical protein EI555_005521 [Monodon monoceros]